MLHPLGRVLFCGGLVGWAGTGGAGNGLGWADLGAGDLGLARAILVNSVAHSSQWLRIV